MWLIGVFALVAVAAITSLVAERKGQRPGMWFLLGLLFPVLALIVAAVVVDPREESRPDEADLREALPDNTIA